MARIDIPRIATILTDVSWMDRLDLTSPSADERQRAATIIATVIVTGLDETELDAPDCRQMTLPIL
jgi:hypothetical protein